jgi:hypothetical protein
VQCARRKSLVSSEPTKNRLHTFHTYRGPAPNVAKSPRHGVATCVRARDPEPFGFRSGLILCPRLVAALSLSFPLRDRGHGGEAQSLPSLSDLAAFFAVARMRPVSPLGEQAIRDALVRLLTTAGLKPREDWISVRLIADPSRWAGRYMVVIDHKAARDPLSRALRRLTGSGETEATGVWVLSEAEARQLCASIAPLP